MENDNNLNSALSAKTQILKEHIKQIEKASDNLAENGNLVLNVIDEIAHAKNNVKSLIRDLSNEKQMEDILVAMGDILYRTSGIHDEDLPDVLDNFSKLHKTTKCAIEDLTTIIQLAVPAAMSLNAPRTWKICGESIIFYEKAVEALESFEKVYSILQMDYLLFDNKYNITYGTFNKIDDSYDANKACNITSELIKSIEHGITTAAELCTTATNSIIMSNIAIDAANKVLEFAESYP